MNNDTINQEGIVPKINPEGILPKFEDIKIPETNSKTIITVGILSLIPVLLCIILNNIIFTYIALVISVIAVTFLSFIILRREKKKIDFIIEENKLQYALNRKLIEDIANRNIKLQEDAIKQNAYTKNESKEDDSKNQN